MACAKLQLAAVRIPVIDRPAACTSQLQALLPSISTPPPAAPHPWAGPTRGAQHGSKHPEAQNTAGSHLLLLIFRQVPLVQHAPPLLHLPVKRALAADLRRAAGKGGTALRICTSQQQQRRQQDGAAAQRRPAALCSRSNLRIGGGCSGSPAVLTLCNARKPSLSRPPGVFDSSADLVDVGGHGVLLAVALVPAADGQQQCISAPWRPKAASHSCTEVWFGLFLQRSISTLEQQRNAAASVAAAAGQNATRASWSHRGTAAL